MHEQYELGLRKLYELYKPQVILYHELGLVNLVDELKVMIQEDEEAEEILKQIRDRLEPRESDTEFEGQTFPSLNPFDKNSIGYMEPKTMDWSDHNA